MFRVPIRPDAALDAILPLLAGTAIIAADGAPGALPYTSIDWQRPHALIIGNEAHGLSAAAHAVADQRIAIPMHRGVESLNAAMAATVILFEAQRQRSSTPRP
jgi:TrmH family RNA methyltransferase